jgi:hypothetical protein
MKPAEIAQQIKHYNDWRQGRVDDLKFKPANITRMLNQAFKALNEYPRIPGGASGMIDPSTGLLPPEDVTVMVELENGQQVLASQHNGFFTRHGEPLAISSWRYLTADDMLQLT